MKMVSINTKLEQLGALVSKDELTSADVFFVQNCYRKTTSCRDMSKLNDNEIEHIEELYDMHFRGFKVTTSIKKPARNPLKPFDSYDDDYEGNDY